MLDEHSPIPLYFQLKNILEHQINSGFFSPGEKIPSENELCNHYNISRTTVRQAISELVIGGKLIRTQGRGTFVAEPRLAKPFYKLSGFSQDMQNQGLTPRSQLLELSPILPPDHVSKIMRLNENEVVVHIKRIRYADDRVMGLDSSYYPFSRFSGLLNEDLENNSL